MSKIFIVFLKVFLSHLSENREGGGSWPVASQAHLSYLFKILRDPETIGGFRCPVQAGNIGGIKYYRDFMLQTSIILQTHTSCYKHQTRTRTTHLSTSSQSPLKACMEGIMRNFSIFLLHGILLHLACRRHLMKESPCCIGYDSCLRYFPNRVFQLFSCTVQYNDEAQRMGWLGDRLSHF